MFWLLVSKDLQMGQKRVWTFGPKKKVPPLEIGPRGVPGLSKIFQDRSRDRKKGFERHIRFLVFGSFLIGCANLTFRPKTRLKILTRFLLKYRWTRARSLASHDSFLVRNRIIRVFLASRDTPDTWSTMLDPPDVPWGHIQSRQNVVKNPNKIPLFF